MGDQQHCGTLAASQFKKCVENGGTVGPVQRAGRLVSQDQPRAVDHSSCHRGPLGLAPGDPRWYRVGTLRETKSIHQCSNSVTDLAPIDPGKVERECDVLPQRQLRDEFGELEHHPKVGTATRSDLVRVQASEVLA
jgi:hypothetical protein